MFEVLIVEDDPMVAMINKQYVMQNKKFHCVGLCRDGNSAWDFLQENRVDLIILDQYMPQKTGLALLRQIRKKELPVSVIMVTAANDGTTVEEALRLGIVDYLVKPFNSGRFNQALEKFASMKLTIADEGLNQKKIDELINGSIEVDSNTLPKGIQEITLNRIREYMRNNPSEEQTGEVIADALGVSRVTVRRYMNYLLEKGEISGRMNYETGGRPSMLYHWIF